MLVLSIIAFVLVTIVLVLMLVEYKRDKNERYYQTAFWAWSIVWLSDLSSILKYLPKH